jgi:hypothetical protein
MRITVRMAVLLLVCAFVLPAAAADKKDAKAEAKEKAAKDKLVNAGVLTGRLSHVEAQQKYFIVQVQIPSYGGGGGGINPGAYQAYLLQQMQVMQIRNPIQRALAMRQLSLQSPLGGGVGGGGMATTSKDIEVQAADDIKVRLMNPPVEFNDKGKPKKYTQKELSRLRGPDRSLPGYTADFENLKPGQTVKVYLVKKKDPPRSPGKKAKDKDDEDASDKRPQARMVVVVAESAEK